jgi:hypothetical protein
MRFVSFSIPLASFLLASLSHVRPVAAEPHEAAEQARAMWKAGARALASGEIENARIAFKQAYDLVPDPELAQSLGEVEFRTGHFADAARHLTRALESKELSADERKVSTSSLEKARTKVGQLFVDANVNAAELRVDGETVGVVLPMKTPWYLDPGPHTVTVHKDRFVDATREVKIEAGNSVRLSFTLSAELREDPLPAPELPKRSQPPPAPPPPPAPAPNPPPPIWFAMEGGGALAALGSGAYFALQPNASAAERSIAGGFLMGGGIVAATTLVIWVVTRPATPPSGTPAASLNPRGLTF